MSSEYAVWKELRRNSSSSGEVNPGTQPLGHDEKPRLPPTSPPNPPPPDIAPSLVAAEDADALDNEEEAVDDDARAQLSPHIEPRSTQTASSEQDCVEGLAPHAIDGDDSGDELETAAVIDQTPAPIPLFKALRRSAVDTMGPHGGKARRPRTLLLMGVILLSAISVFMFIRWMIVEVQRQEGEPSSSSSAASGLLPGSAAFWHEAIAEAQGMREEQQKMRHAGGSSGELMIIGDLHGDLEKGLEALRMVGAVDEHGSWIGSSSTLVQMGDIVDRGHNSLELIDLFERLKAEASLVGGKVVTLLGNHELMLIQGDYRYVSRQEVRRLGSTSLPQATFDGRAPEGHERGHGGASGEHDGGRKLTQLEEMRGGFAKWGELMQPEGSYGRMIRKRPIAFIHNTSGCSFLFVHAGIVPSLVDQVDQEMRSAWSYAEVSDRKLFESALSSLLPELHVSAWNTAVRNVLDDCKDYTCSSSSRPMRAGRKLAEALIGGEGAVWTRVYTEQPNLGCRHVASVTQELGVSRIVVGHTIQSSGKIVPKCGGRLLMVDVGMSAAILGNLAVVRCAAASDDSMRCAAKALYKAGDVPLC